MLRSVSVRSLRSIVNASEKQDSPEGSPDVVNLRVKLMEYRSLSDQQAVLLAQERRAKEALVPLRV